MPTSSTASRSVASRKKTESNIVTIVASHGGFVASLWDGLVSKCRALNELPLERFSATHQPGFRNRMRGAYKEAPWQFKGNALYQLSLVRYARVRRASTDKANP
jgi:hypothetical protein